MRKLILIPLVGAIFLLLGIGIFAQVMGQTDDEYKKELSSQQLEIVRQKIKDLKEGIRLDPNNKGSFSYWGYLYYPGQWNFYYVICATGNLEIHLTDIPEFSDYDLYLFDCNGVELARSWNSGNDDEQIIKWVTTNTYWIEVYCYSGGDPDDPYHLYGTYATRPKLPDLVLQSLTASDYFPTIGEQITISLKVKNQGDTVSSGCFTGLYKNLSSSPTPSTPADYLWWTFSLAPGDTTQFTQVVTNYNVETWHMYGLTDSYGSVTEMNECNNVNVNPVNVVWHTKADLIVYDVCIGTDNPEIGDSVNVTVVIENQGGDTAHNFRTDLFYDRSSPPYPPATGNDYFFTSSLAPGGTEAWAFYISSDQAATWRMYVLVDSWNNEDEGNENNNVWGPEYVNWTMPAKLGLITRQAIIDTAWTFVRVHWQCPSLNGYPPPDTYCVEPNNDTTWTSDFVVGNWYFGEAYEWGGWDKPNRFLYKLEHEQRAGVHQRNDCFPDTGRKALVDPCWSTGIDCSGLVSRCWQLSWKRNTKGLFGVAHQISYDSLKMGDALDDTTIQNNRHVRLFFQRLQPPDDTLIIVFESISYRIGIGGPPYNGCDTNTYSENFLIARDYIPIRYNNLYDPPNNNPVISGHLHCMYPQDECACCFHHEEERTIEIDAYDPDGDTLHYVWWCNFGYFIIGGNPVYACTTYENYVLYQAPISFWNEDQLFVDVCDNRGGDTLTDGVVEVLDPGYSCICGDANRSGVIEVSDITTIIGYLFKGGRPPLPPIERGDANNNCVIDVGDATVLINYLYKGGSPPECCWIH